METTNTHLFVENTDVKSQGTLMLMKSTIFSVMLTEPCGLEQHSSKHDALMTAPNTSHANTPKSVLSLTLPPVTDSASYKPHYNMHSMTVYDTEHLSLFVTI